MAVNDQSHTPGAAGRRFLFGTNVTVVVLLTAFVVVGINYIGHRHNVRADLTRGFASHRLSDRAKRIIKSARGNPKFANLQVTTVYTSDEPEMDRRKYFPDLQDLCEEVRQFDKRITIAHLHSGAERAKLRDRIQGKFGSAAKAHSDAVSLGKDTWTEAENVLKPTRDAVETLQQRELWLSRFSPLAKVAHTLREDLKSIEDGRRDVEDAVGGEGIPRFKEANDKIKEVNDKMKKGLEDTQDWLKEMDKLVQVLSQADSEFAQQTKAKVAEAAGLVANLKQIIGDPQDPNVPDDPKPVLQQFARATNTLAEWLVTESARISAFEKNNPAIRLHPQWDIGFRQGPLVFKMSLPELLTAVVDSLSKNVQRIRQIIASDLRLDELQGYVRDLRRVAVVVQEQIDLWSINLPAILNEGSQIDQDSRDFIARGSKGELFKAILDKLNELSTKISGLPELKLDEVAKRLQEENIVILETDDDARVLKFEEVWPFADPTRQFGMSEEFERRRVFDGDSAISSAIMAMQSEKKQATVILVGYEPAPPPGGSPFQRPPSAPIPMNLLSVLKEKLEQASFAVKEWNLAGEDARKPEPEVGTRPIYVILPPAPPEQPNFMMRQQPTRSFGDKELGEIKSLLSQGGRAIFLAMWEPPPIGPFGGPPPTYAFDTMLESDWGVKVHFEHRLIRAVPDRKEPGLYSLNRDELIHMQLSSFTDQPIGEPLKARRMLMYNVCPVTATDKLPEGVTVTPVLDVPAADRRDTWAEQNKGIFRIMDALTGGHQRGEFTKDSATSWDPPFSVIVAAENGKAQSKIVVMGTGISIIDPYVTQRVQRIDERSRLIIDPPPRENMDVLINSVYWLNDQQDLIAAGPAEVPRIPALDPRQKNTLWVLAAGWAFAVLLVGGVMMMVRRK